MSGFDPEMIVGRYSSISRRVEAMGSAHPTAWASTSPFSYAPRALRGIIDYLADIDGEYQTFAFDQGPQQVVIGNDVWIGADVLLKRGVTIGDGAVIAARSLVTHDVPPYAIVAGQPARLLRMRFHDALIERFLASQWWRFAVDAIAPLDVREPELFLDRIDQGVADGRLTPFFPPITIGSDLIAAAET